MTDIQELRLLIGDLDSVSPLLSDAQLQFFLDEHNDDPSEAAPFAAQALYALMSVQAVDQTTGSISVALSQRAANYLLFLKARGWGPVEGASLASCYAAGVQQSEIDTDLADDSIAPRKFTLDLHEAE